jgi:geranylgeranyl diphosphate synthase type II
VKTTAESANPANAAEAQVEELSSRLESSLAAVVPGLSGAGAADAATPSREFGVDRLVESMRYSLQTPGKRVRPLLLLAAARGLGASLESSLPFATALEMIHAYSLIHDDLPAMDDDELRRGQPTNHVLFGDGMATLAGDGLLTEAFCLLMACGTDPALTLLVAGEFARAAGVQGMVGGQAADLMAEGLQSDDDDCVAAVDGDKHGDRAELLRAIHRRKTGELLQVSAVAGALLAGADSAQLAAADDFGLHFGLAFQIADDLKDELLDTAATGKRAGGDRARGKLTYPAVHGVARSLELGRAELTAALAALAPLGPAGELLQHIASSSVVPVFELAAG